MKQPLRKLVVGEPRRLALRWGVLLGLALLLWLAYPWVYGHHHARRAEQAQERQDCAEALGHLRKCLTVWPDSGEHHFAAARCSWREGDPEAADRHLREAARCGWPAQDIDAETLFITAQKELTPPVEASLGNLLRVAKERGDVQMQALILEAMALAMAAVERRGEAGSLAMGLVELQPESWRGHRLLGHVLAPQDPETAAASYGRSVALKPAQPKVHRFLAIYSARMAKPRETLDHLRAAQPLAADDVDATLAEAKARLLLGELAEARTLLERALAVAGADDPRIWTVKGRLELDQHGPAEATPWLEKAAARTPYLPETVDALIALAARRGDADKVRLYTARKEQYTKAGEEAKILGKKMDALYRQPNADPAAMEATGFRLGQLMFLLAQDDAGVKWMQTVLANNPRHTEAHLALAEYCDRIGAKAKAAEHRRGAGK